MVLGFRKAMVGACLALAAGSAPAFAQENLDAGKSAVQLFNSDCAICHKSPQGLSKGGGLLGLSSFLREHYTASRETAALLAAYLKQQDGPAPAAKQPPVRRARASKPKTEEDRKKAEEAREKAGESKPAHRPADAAAKPAEAKPAEAKPTENKPAEAKPAETKPADEKPAEAKPDTGHAANAKSGSKSDSKSDSKAEPAKTSADKPADAHSDKKE
jgi:hypothetical protein